MLSLNILRNRSVYNAAVFLPHLLHRSENARYAGFLNQSQSDNNPQVFQLTSQIERISKGLQKIKEQNSISEEILTTEKYVSPKIEYVPILSNILSESLNLDPQLKKSFSFIYPQLMKKLKHQPKGKENYEEILEIIRNSYNDTELMKLLVSLQFAKTDSKFSVYLLSLLQFPEQNMGEAQLDYAKKFWTLFPSTVISNFMECIKQDFSEGINSIINFLQNNDEEIPLKIKEEIISMINMDSIDQYIRLKNDFIHKALYIKFYIYYWTHKISIHFPTIEITTSPSELFKLFQIIPKKFEELQNSFITSMNSLSIQEVLSEVLEELNHRMTILWDTDRDCDLLGELVNFSLQKMIPLVILLQQSKVNTLFLNRIKISQIFAFLKSRVYTEGIATNVFRTIRWIEAARFVNQNESLFIEDRNKIFSEYWLNYLKDYYSEEGSLPFHFLNKKELITNYEDILLEIENSPEFKISDSTAELLFFLFQKSNLEEEMQSLLRNWNRIVYSTNPTLHAQLAAEFILSLNLYREQPDISQNYNSISVSSDTGTDDPYYYQIIKKNLSQILPPEKLDHNPIFVMAMTKAYLKDGNYEYSAKYLLSKVEEISENFKGSESQIQRIDKWLNKNKGKNMKNQELLQQLSISEIVESCFQQLEDNFKDAPPELLTDLIKYIDLLKQERKLIKSIFSTILPPNSNFEHKILKEVAYQHLVKYCPELNKIREEKYSFEKFEEIEKLFDEGNLFNIQELRMEMLKNEFKKNVELENNFAEYENWFSNLWNNVHEQMMDDDKKKIRLDQLKSKNSFTSAEKIVLDTFNQYEPVEAEIKRQIELIDERLKKDDYDLNNLEQAENSFKEEKELKEKRAILRRKIKVQFIKIYKQQLEKNKNLMMIELLPNVSKIPNKIVSLISSKLAQYSVESIIESSLEEKQRNSNQKMISFLENAYHEYSKVQKKIENMKSSKEIQREIQRLPQFKKIDLLLKEINYSENKIPFQEKEKISKMIFEKDKAVTVEKKGKINQKLSELFESNTVNTFEENITQYLQKKPQDSKLYSSFLEKLLKLNPDPFDSNYFIDLIQFGIDHKITAAIRIAEACCSKLNLKLPTKIQKEMVYYIANHPDEYHQSRILTGPIDTIKIYEKSLGEGIFKDMSLAGFFNSKSLQEDISKLELLSYKKYKGLEDIFNDKFIQEVHKMKQMHEPFN